jgi:methyl-accepting chemotaxis protein
MADGPDSRTSFLPLAEAAARLGVSRLKLREAAAKGVIPARRDNQGRLRVDLDAAPGDLAAAAADRPAKPGDLMEALFDEIEELSGELEDSAAMRDRLAALVEAQDAALSRATAALEAATSDRDRLAGLAGRALEAAEEAEVRAAKLGEMSARSLEMLERATGALESMQGEIGRLKADAADKETAIEGHAQQLERLFTLSEQALDKAAAARREPTLIARVFGRGGRG